MLPSGNMLIGIKSAVFAFMLVLPAFITPASAAVVSGEFVYVEEGDGSLVQYHVDAVDYQGIQAWRIAWECEQLKATHYLRRSDGLPLYVKRINHALNRTIEISYSQNDTTPTIYSKRSMDEVLDRKIWAKGLRDLGTLPQLLLSSVQTESSDDISFSAIDYDDGKVYPLIAKQAGFKYMGPQGERIRCAIYDVRLNSWLSTFVGKTRLLIPVVEQSSNFVAYQGPGLDGVSDSWSLRLIGRDRSLALLEKDKRP